MDHMVEIKDSTVLGDKLADFVDKGGNVVVCMMSNVDNGVNYPTGRFTDYHPFKLEGFRYLPSLGDTVDICLENHPMMEGVSKLEYQSKLAIEGALHKRKRAGVEVVGKWKEDKGNVIGIRYDKKGLVVSIGCVCTDRWMKGDAYQLLKNAVRYRKHGGKKNK